MLLMLSLKTLLLTDFCNSNLCNFISGRWTTHETTGRILTVGEKRKPDFSCFPWPAFCVSAHSFSTLEWENTKSTSTRFNHVRIQYKRSVLRRQCRDKSNYTITWLLCAFSLVINRDLHTQMTSNPRHITSANLFFFFHAPKTLQKIVNFSCIKQIDNIFPCVCVYCNRS